MSDMVTSSFLFLSALYRKKKTNYKSNTHFLFFFFKHIRFTSMSTPIFQWTTATARPPPSHVAVTTSTEPLVVNGDGSALMQEEVVQQLLLGLSGMYQAYVKEMGTRQRGPDAMEKHILKLRQDIHVIAKLIAWVRKQCGPSLRLLYNQVVHVYARSFLKNTRCVLQLLCETTLSTSKVEASILCHVHYCIERDFGDDGFGSFLIEYLDARSASKDTAAAVRHALMIVFPATVMEHWMMWSCHRLGGGLYGGDEDDDEDDDGDQYRMDDAPTRGGVRVTLEEDD
jgi:hypothetical protein